jgi:HAD superfamily hydrolase (TIGR01458 family)
VAAGNPDAVLVGDLGEIWSYALLQEAFEYLMGGAALIALSRDRYWMREGRLRLDAGPFVAGLEFAVGRKAIVAGKPCPAFYEAALSSLGLAQAGSVAMVGDDLWSDVEGAQQAGLQGWLVRTGKYRESALADAAITPDRILASIADLG